MARISLLIMVNIISGEKSEEWAGLVDQRGTWVNPSLCGRPHESGLLRDEGGCQSTGPILSR